MKIPSPPGRLAEVYCSVGSYRVKFRGPEIAAKKSENFEISEENIENIGSRKTILNHTVNLKTKIQKCRGKIRKNSQNRKTELIQS